MMACVFIPHFAAAVERQLNPALSKVPLLIGNSECLVAISSELADSGIRPGMSLRLAQDLCPQARILPVQPVQYQRTADKLLGVLSTFTGLVELNQTQPALIGFLDLGNLANREEAGLAKELGQAIRTQTGLSSALGLACGKFVTQVAAAATSFNKAAIIVPGREATFLAPRSVNLLPLDESLAVRFEQLGLRTLGQLAGLPGGAVLTQFGRYGYWLHELAKGCDTRPVRHFSSTLEESITRQLEEPVNNRMVLQALGREVTNELACRLQANRQVAGRLKLILGLEDRSEQVEEVRLHQSTNDSERLMRVLDSLIEHVHVQIGIVAFSVTMTDLTQVLGRQLDLFIHQTGQENRLSELLPSLVARFGARCFFHPTATDPAAYLLEQRFHLEPIKRV